MTVCRQKPGFPIFFKVGILALTKRSLSGLSTPVSDNGGIWKDSCKVILARLVSSEAILFLS